MDDAIFSSFQRDLETIAEHLTLNIKIVLKSQKMRTLLMVSKFDHCLADILYRTQTGCLPITVTAIASNVPINGTSGRVIIFNKAGALLSDFQIDTTGAVL